MSILQKISEFFIPSGGAGTSSSDFGLRDSKQAPVIRSHVEQINDDLAQLVELGEYEKALQLGRKYNFYNRHLLIAHAAVSAEAFNLVELALHDMILGPLQGMAAQAMEQSGTDEFFYLPRSLYLVNYIGTHLRSAHNYQQLTNDILELWEENPSFHSFTERFGAQISARDEAERLPYAQRILEQHLILNYEKLDEIFDLDHHAFAVDASELEGITIEDYFSDQRIELHNRIAEQKRAMLKPRDLALFQQAQRNLNAYLETGSPAGYILSQAKMDMALVIEHLSPDASIQLARKLALLDYYPILAFQFYQGGDTGMAYEIMREFVHRSNVLSAPHSFADERFKAEVVNFIVYLSKCGPDGCRYQVAYDAAAAWHPQYAMDMIAKLADDAGAYNPDQHFPEVVIEPLKQSTKLFFNA